MEELVTGGLFFTLIGKSRLAAALMYTAVAKCEVGNVG